MSPNEGSIEIDGNKIPKNSESSNWRKKIGYISQNLYLYKTSILNNIIMSFNKEINLDEKLINKIDDLCKVVNLKNLIDSFPDKYLHELSEMGSNLSKGQIQRISIVRELYRDPEILIFDEPTSSLDSENIEYFNKFINSIKGKYTIIVITHNKSILTKASCIYEIKNENIYKVN